MLTSPIVDVVSAAFTAAPAKSNTMQPPKKPSAKPSPKLAAMLSKLTPAEREKAIKVAAALLNKRAEREANGGTVDLTKKT
ncbi:MAG: hypothetical protein RI907_995 [Pseudomonadota bacterium]|jgi:hypothetical protein